MKEKKKKYKIKNYLNDNLDLSTSEYLTVNDSDNENESNE